MAKTLTIKLEVYDINEIVVEKMRALLQFAKKLHERGWGRSRVRDYYDLWRIFGTYGSCDAKSPIRAVITPSLADITTDATR